MVQPLIYIGRIQTEKSKIEAGFHSDRGRPKKRGRVRKRVPFGQGKAKKERASPKAGLIRTGES
jgi:hypothetical protein